MLIAALLACAAASAPALTPEQWRSDLAYLAKELPARHKNAFAHVSRADFEKAVAALDARIPQLSESGIRIGILKLVASIGDAHTSMWAWDQSEDLRFLPLRISVFSDGYFITAASSEYRNLLGAKIERVGPMSIAGAGRALAAYIPHETEAWLKVNLPRMLVCNDILYDAGLADSPARARVEAVSPAGERMAVDVEAAPRSKLPKLLPAFTGEPPLYRRNAQKKYWATTIADGTAVYFQYNRCLNDPGHPFPEFRRELRQMLALEKVDRLILDLRFNYGGNSLLLDNWIGSWVGEIKASRFNRKGHLFVLIGPVTFSSALDNAASIREKTAATFIGEPTGGALGSFGEVKDFELPESHIKIGYSTKYFQLGKGGGSLMPDIPVEESSRDYFAGADPALAAALR